MLPNQDNSVSVIIPAYNYGNYIGECLDSVIAQTFPNWECIIMDNGSTDNTAQIVQTYTAKDKRIKYHFCEQKGVSYARNKAIGLSTGIYILPLDADDKIAPGYIEKALNAIVKNEALKVVYCDAELFGAASGKWLLPEYSLKTLLIENCIFCTALFRKADYDATEGYNENMKEGFEDWDFWISLLGNGGEVYKIPEVLFYYRIRANSRNNSLQKEKQLNLRRRIVENHRALYDQLLPTADLVFQLYEANNHLKSTRQSFNYKTGQFLLTPLHFLKRFFKR